MNIQEYRDKIKRSLALFVGEWGLIALIFVAIIGAFGLGRLSVLIEGKPLITISAAGAAAAPTIPRGGMYVAARGGSVYYFPWCSGASKISMQNERWFKTEEDAKRAGYRPAKNCKGLAD